MEPIKAVCRNCHQSFICFRRRNFCSEECMKDYSLFRKPKRKVASERKSKRNDGLFSLTCSVCGKTFQSVSEDERLCSDECLQEAMKKPRKSRTGGMRKCLVCGGDFMASVESDRCCSDRCRRKIDKKLHDDEIEAMISWVTSTCVEVTPDEWRVLRVLYFERRPLKLVEIAFSARVRDACIARAVDRLAGFGIISSVDVGGGAYMLTLPKREC